MPSVSTVLVVTFAAIAGATDLLYRKIFNWTTYTGILAAFVVNGWEQGWEAPGGLEDSLMGFGLCGGLMLVSFVLFSVGGGDVKLMAMLGAFLGLERGIEAVLWSFVLAGIVAVAILIWRVGFMKLMAGCFRQVLWTLRLVSWVPLTAAERKELQQPLRLAPTTVLAVVIVSFDLVRFF